MIKNNILDKCLHIVEFHGGVYEGMRIEGLKKGDTLTATIDYPLGVPEDISLVWEENPYKLAAQICDEYRRIYKEEEETSENKEERLCDEHPGCTLINRNNTTGKYKIWGHHIGDLVLEGLVINAEKKTVESVQFYNETPYGAGILI